MNFKGIFIDNTGGVKKNQTNRIANLPGRCDGRALPLQKGAVTVPALFTPGQNGYYGGKQQKNSQQDEQQVFFFHNRTREFCGAPFSDYLGVQNLFKFFQKNL